MGGDGFLGWAPICNEFPLIPSGRRLRRSLPAERMWDGSNCGRWGFLLYTTFLASDSWVHLPPAEVAGAIWLGNHCPVAHPEHITLESLALACCMWFHMVQQGDETAGEPA